MYHLIVAICIINDSVEFHWLIPTELVCLQSISSQTSTIVGCDILYFDVTGHVIKLPSITEPDTLSTTSSMLLYTYNVYMHNVCLYCRICF